MSTRARHTAVASAALLTVVTTAGCAGSSDQASSGSSSTAPSPTPPSTAASKTPGPGGADNAATATITIKNFAYSGPSSVAPGTKITVRNEDSQAHTLTAQGGKEFDVKIDPGGSATFTAPKAPGSYSFICLYHSNMSGTLKVAA